ncbi:hypothetical protein BH09VER1_BH09VER1_54300 [soil metagenome]
MGRVEEEVATGGHEGRRGMRQGLAATKGGAKVRKACITQRARRAQRGGGGTRRGFTPRTQRTPRGHLEGQVLRGGGKMVGLGMWWGVLRKRSQQEGTKEEGERGRVGAHERAVRRKPDLRCAQPMSEFAAASALPYGLPLAGYVASLRCLHSHQERKERQGGESRRRDSRQGRMLGWGCGGAC